MFKSTMFLINFFVCHVMNYKYLKIINIVNLSETRLVKLGWQSFKFFLNSTTKNFYKFKRI